jgi:uncharacterized protein DUF3987
MFGNAAGRHPYTLVGNLRHWCNLYMAQVGATSRARKGTAEGEIRHLFELADEEWATNHVAGGLSSGEGLLWQLRDGTAEGDGVTDKRLLAVEPEFASVLKRAQRQDNVLSATLRELWDRGYARTMTKRDPCMVTGGHLSVIAHCTRLELQRTLTETEQTNGFANRFLFVCSRRSRRLPNGGTPANLNHLLPRLRKALDFAGSCHDPIRRDAAADAVWAEWYNALPDDADGMRGAVTARAEAQALRLSLVYAVMDQSPTIRRDHVEAALALWDYCEASARYIFGRSTGDRIAEKIDALLLERERTRDELHECFQHNVRTDRIDGAIEVLVTAGRAAVRQESTGGRPRTIYSHLSAFSRDVAYGPADDVREGPARPVESERYAERRDNGERARCLRCARLRPCDCGATAA